MACRQGTAHWPLKRAKSASSLLCRLSCLYTTRPDSKACSVGKKKRREIRSNQMVKQFSWSALGAGGLAAAQWQPSGCWVRHSPGLCVVTGQPGSAAWILHKPWPLISRREQVLQHYILVLWVNLFGLYITSVCIWLASALLWIQPTTD